MVSLSPRASLASAEAVATGKSWLSEERAVVAIRAKTFKVAIFASGLDAESW